jgi:hypothetical protein
MPYNHFMPIEAENHRVIHKIGNEYPINLTSLNYCNESALERSLFDLSDIHGGVVVLSTDETRADAYPKWLFQKRNRFLGIPLPTKRDILEATVFYEYNATIDAILTRVYIKIVQREFKSEYLEALLHKSFFYVAKEFGDVHFFFSKYRQKEGYKMVASSAIIGDKIDETS